MIPRLKVRSAMSRVLGKLKGEEGAAFWPVGVRVQVDVAGRAQNLKSLLRELWS